MLTPQNYSFFFFFFKIHFHIFVFAGERWRVKGGGRELRYNRAAEGEQNRTKNGDAYLAKPCSLQEERASRNTFILDVFAKTFMLKLTKWRRRSSSSSFFLANCIIKSGHGRQSVPNDSGAINKSYPICSRGGNNPTKKKHHHQLRSVVNKSLTYSLFIPSAEY